MLLMPCLLVMPTETDYSDFNLSSNATLLPLDECGENSNLFSIWLRVLFAVLFASEIVFSVFGNVTILSAFWLDRSLRLPRYYCLFNLCICDLLRGVLCMPYTLLDYVDALDSPPYSAFCRFGLFVQYLLWGESVWSIILISADRYLLVKNPIHYLSGETWQRTVSMLTSTWTAMTVYTAITVWLWDYFEDIRWTNCSVCIAAYELSYYASEVAIGEFVIPAFLVVLFNFLIYSNIVFNSDSLILISDNQNSSGGCIENEEKSLLLANRKCSKVREGRVFFPLGRKEKRSMITFTSLCDDSVAFEPNCSVVPFKANLSHNCRSISCPSLSPSSSTELRSRNSQRLFFSKSLNHLDNKNSKSDVLYLRRQHVSPNFNPLLQSDQLPNYNYKINGKIDTDCSSGRLSSFVANQSNSIRTSSVDLVSMCRRRNRVRNVRINHKKIRRSLSILVGFYLACWMPIMASQIWNRVCRGCVTDLTFAILAVVANLSPAINPFLHGMSHRKFNKAGKKMWCHLFRMIVKLFRSASSYFNHNTTI